MKIYSNDELIAMSKEELMLAYRELASAYQHHTKLVDKGKSLIEKMTDKKGSQSIQRWFLG